MPYAVLSEDGLVEQVESTLDGAVQAAEEAGAADVVIDAAADDERESNPPPAGRGALKQLRLPGGPQLAISDDAVRMDLNEAWHRVRALMPPFTQRGKTGIERVMDPSRTRATTIKSFLGQNAKTSKKKGDAADVDVQGLNLTPYWLFGQTPAPLGLGGTSEQNLPNMCAGSSAACRHSCLVFAGQNYAADWSIFAKFQKTRVLFGDPDAFGRILLEACRKHLKYAPKSDYMPAVRLNVLSDVPWELVFPALFEELPTLQFYDYTKVPGREPPPNYDLTFSNSGGNKHLVERQLAAGHRVAVVAHVPTWRSGAPISKGREESEDAYTLRRDIATHELWSDRLPPSCTIGDRTYKVIDGDVNDVRFLDPKPTIVALRWKSPGGQAASRGPEALRLSQQTKFVVEIEDFCGLWIGAVTPSDQPDTEIQTVFSIEPLQANPAQPRRWGTGRAGYSEDHARRTAARLARGG